MSYKLTFLQMELLDDEYTSSPEIQCPVSMRISLFFGNDSQPVGVGGE